jgi:hypothetical protein
MLLVGTVRWQDMPFEATAVSCVGPLFPGRLVKA